MVLGVTGAVGGGGARENATTGEGDAGVNATTGDASAGNWSENAFSYMPVKFSTATVSDTQSNQSSVNRLRRTGNLVHADGDHETERSRDEG